MVFLKKSRFLLLIVFCLYWMSCGDPAPRTKMNREEKRIVDSLYSVELKAIKKETSYTCSDLRDSLFPIFVDSIRELRLIEVDQIIND